MKKLTQFVAAALLVTAFAVSVYAGDMQMPPVPPPPAPDNITVSAPTTDGSILPASDAGADFSIVALDLLSDLFSMY